MAKEFFANNDLPADLGYDHRLQYKDNAFNIDTSGIIDFWYDHDAKMYGRIDTLGNIVVPFDENLADVDGMFMLDFVAEAYKEFMERIKKIKASGQVCSPSYLDLVMQGDPPAITWPNDVPSVALAHHNYMEVVYEVFSEAFMDEHENKKEVRNFDTFMEKFRRFILLFCGRYPMTRAGYIESPMYNILSSGLAIDLLEGDHSDDSAKEDLFVRHPGFPIYREAVKSSGFAMDKNAPWRLVVDLNSLAMQKHMVRFGITSAQDMFDKYYYTVYKIEVELLKEYVKAFYNSYVLLSPQSVIVGERKKCLTEDTSSCYTTIVSRSAITDSEFAKYPDSFWLELYAFVRSEEMKLAWDPPRYKVFVKHLKERNKYQGYNISLDHVNMSLRDLARNKVEIDSAAEIRTSPLAPPGPDMLPQGY